MERNIIHKIQNVLDAAKAVLKGKFIVIKPTLRNKKDLNLTLNLKELEKDEQSRKLVEG